MHALLHDDAGAEEADAGDDIGGDLGRAWGPLTRTPSVTKDGRADRDQHIGAKARVALPILPLRADRTARTKAIARLDAEVEKSTRRRNSGSTDTIELLPSRAPRKCAHRSQ